MRLDMRQGLRRIQTDQTSFDVSCVCPFDKRTSSHR